MGARYGDRTFGEDGGDLMRSNVLAIENVTKRYNAGVSIVGRAGRPSVAAVEEVSLEIGERQMVGLVGESGSGKSTLASLIVRLDRPSVGTVRLAGEDIWKLRGKRLRTFRRDVQMVFQDPYATLNPRFTVRQTLAETLAAHGLRRRDVVQELSERALERAELRPAKAFLSAHPSQLSGGQRQRVAIARAIVLEPKLLVADEPVSMLDVSVRSGILNLFERLGDELGLSMLFISHDLSTVSHLCDRVAVMYRGRIVEEGPVASVLTAPFHPYTKALLDAVPPPEPGAWARDGSLGDELQEAQGVNVSRIVGCRYVDRCPRRSEVCYAAEPDDRELGPQHKTRCYHPIAPGGVSVLNGGAAASAPKAYESRGGANKDREAS